MRIRRFFAFLEVRPQFSWGKRGANSHPKKLKKLLSDVTKYFYICLIFSHRSFLFPFDISFSSLCFIQIIFTSIPIFLSHLFIFRPLLLLQLFFQKLFSSKHIRTTFNLFISFPCSFRQHPTSKRILCLFIHLFV